MSDLQRAARIALAMRLLAEIARNEGDAARVTTSELMREIGAERVRVTDDVGTDLGTVTLATRRPTPRVVDERAFTAWVAKRYPHEVVSTVRESFRRRLLDDCRRAGDAIVPDTGEVVPGVEMATGEPYLALRPTGEARDRLRALLATAGALGIEGGGA